MIEQTRWSRDAAVPIAAGAVWLWFATGFGLVGFLFSLIPGCLLFSDQVRDLWLHWERPRIVWYQGGHLTFNRDRAVRRLIRDALSEGGLIRAPHASGSQAGEPAS